MSFYTMFYASNRFNCPSSRKKRELLPVTPPTTRETAKIIQEENRCLLPNPITIAQKEKTPSVERGTVSVRVVYENREEIEQSKHGILEGKLVQPFDSENKAQFCLKILGTSESRKFRLLFTANFVSCNNVLEETILSHPFSVTSNKKKLRIENPIIFDIKPKAGLATEETEIWIKGKQFTERTSMVVKFGNQLAKISETEENLITCVVPSLGNIDEDTVVPVEVSNFHPSRGQLDADTPLTFTYLPDPRRKKSKTSPFGESLSLGSSKQSTKNDKQTFSQSLNSACDLSSEFMVLDFMYDMSGNKDSAQMDTMSMLH